MICLGACHTSSKYQDNQVLEQPPVFITINDNTQEEPAITEKKSDTGLNDAVILLNSQSLILRQSFDNAWKTLEKALVFNQIKISDRHREQGTYFVDYDPDDAPQSDGFTENINFLLFKDDYEKSLYKLTMTEKENGVLIRAERMTQKRIDLLEDGEDIRFDDKIEDGKEKLLKHLYGTLKNDLPLD
jgi:uncharacterized lipoprotein